MILLKKHNARPYEALCKSLESNNKCAIVSATGTGKSYIAAKYVDEHFSQEKCLIFTPNNIAKNVWHKLLPKARVVSYQKLVLSKEIISSGEYDIVVCDELHHLGAKSWGEKFTGFLENYKGKLIGLSATPIRYLDAGRDMVKEFFNNEMVVGKELPEAISDGILPSFDYVAALYSLPNEEEYADIKDTPVTKKLLTQLDILRSKYSMQSILRNKIGQETKKVSVFVNQVENLDEIKTMCQDIFPEADHFIAHSGMKKHEVKSIFSKFEKGEKLSFIYTVDLLNEGAHIDGVNCIIMFRKTKSPTVYLQQLGRVLTTDAQNERVKIFDFVANHENLKTYMDIQESTVGWIQSGITNPKRQIVIEDYALEEIDVVEKLKKLTSTKWTKEEDEILLENYDEGKGLEKVANLLPWKTRKAIKSRAIFLGVTKQRFIYPESFQKDLKLYYNEKGGIDILLEKYPFLKYSTLVNVANRMGYKKKEGGSKWTKEEDSILFENQEADFEKLMQLLPNRSKASITGRRHILEIGNLRHKWTEAENEIIKANVELTSTELQQKFFPEFSLSVINTQRKVLNCQREITWSLEKINLFKELYSEGGYKAVLEHPDFVGSNKVQISGAAHRYNVKVKNNGSIPWTENEINLIREYLNLPEEEKYSIKELAEKIPAHTYSAVKNKVKFVLLEKTA